MPCTVVAMPAATPARRARGFSLLELLVALIVVALITSLVTLTVSSGGQDVRLESQVRGLADAAEFMLDEAQMTGQDFGLLLAEEFIDGERVFTYRWQERRLEGWVDVPSREAIFAPQVLPPGIELELELDNAPVGDLTFDEEDDEILRNPQVVLYASGETTEGALTLYETDGGDVLWRIEWDLLGRFDLLPRGVAEDDEDDF